MPEQPADSAAAFASPLQLTPRAAVALALQTARLARRLAGAEQVDAALASVAGYVRGADVPGQELRAAWAACIAARESLEAAVQAVRAAHAAVEGAAEPNHLAVVPRAAEDAALALEVAARSLEADEAGREEAGRRARAAYLRAGQALLRRHPAGGGNDPVDLPEEGG